MNKTAKLINLAESTGAIGIVYRNTNKGRQFVLVSQKSGHLSVAGGGKEEIDQNDDDKTIVRELNEELGLSKNQYKMRKLSFRHNFLYGPWKKERAGQQASNSVYLILMADGMEIQPNRSEIVDAYWVNEADVIEKIWLPDLKTIFKKAILEI
jgi:isopentenyldiphosphate isomerase